MGEEINIHRIECHGENAYIIEFHYEESKKWERVKIQKQALFALLAVAEKEYAETDFKG